MINRNGKNGTMRLNKRPTSRVYNSDVSRKIHIEYLQEKDAEKIKNNNLQADIRKEISLIIAEMVYNNSSTLEIINVLNNEERFSEYGQYFQTWIEDRLKAKTSMERRIIEERKNGKSDEEIIKVLRNISKSLMDKRYIKKLVLSEKIIEEKEDEIGHE